jgi:uncharacterized protein
MRFLSAALLTLLLCSLPALALEVPPPGSYVNDRAELISQAVELKLEQFLRDFERSDSTQIVVLTIPSIEDETVETYAVKVFQSWKIGQQGKDNGALLLVAKAERKLRIEVGYGLEGRLTDLLAGRIIDNEITPRLQQGDYDAGLVAGVVAMAEAVRGEYQGSGRTKGSKKNSRPFGLLFLLFFLGPLLGRLVGGRRGVRRSGIFYGGPFIGGGGFGGGGGGFSGGGGGSGGGGASGGW